MKSIHASVLVCHCAWALCLGACSPAGGSTAPNTMAQACVQAGGMLALSRSEDGVARHMCKSPSGRLCDEWAIRRGQCGL
jgi:putative hemolysin